MEIIAAVEKQDSRIIFPGFSCRNLLRHLAVMKLSVAVHLTEIAVSRFKSVCRYADAHNLSFRNITSRSGNGSLIITAFDNVICGNYQIILGSVITEAGNGNRRGCLLAFLLIETAVPKALKYLQLAFYDIGIPVRGNDIKFFTERDVPGDGFLE